MNKAKEAAYGTRCVGNLKQIGLALMSYVNDYKETFPELMRRDWKTSWSILLYQNGYLNNGKILLCPRDKNGSWSRTSPTTHTNITYGGNYNFLQFFNLQPDVMTLSLMQKLKRQYAAQSVVLFGDTWSQKSGDAFGLPDHSVYYLYTAWKGSFYYPGCPTRKHYPLAVRHSRKAFVLYDDMHVGPKSYGDYSGYNPFYDTQWRKQ